MRLPRWGWLLLGIAIVLAVVILRLAVIGA